MSGLPSCLTEQLCASDRELLAGLAYLMRRRDEWNACRSERERKAILQDREEVQRQCFVMGKVAKQQAVSLVALIAKADYHLADWRDKNPEDRSYGHYKAGLEMVLEQAMATLTQLKDPVTVGIVE